MSRLNNVTDTFLKRTVPTAAFIIYAPAVKGPDGDPYVESYTFGPEGRMRNAHPLTDSEMDRMSKIMQKQKASKQFLHCAGLLPSTVLHINKDQKECTWFTPAKEQPLFFLDAIGIPSGKGYVPALLWQANQGRLRLYALGTNKRPDEKSKLYSAPFPNIGSSNVCMGTVNIKFKPDCSVQDFTQQWETYFFNSYFSHANAQTTATNLVQLWTEQIQTDRPFPTSALKLVTTKLNDLLK